MGIGRYTSGFLQLVPVNYRKQQEQHKTVGLMFSTQLVSPHQELGDRYDQGPHLLRLKSIHAHVGVDMEEGITPFPLEDSKDIPGVIFNVRAPKTFILVNFKRLGKEF